MNYMYVIYTLDTFARKSNIAIAKTEDDANKAIMGLRANGMNVGYDKVEIWETITLIQN
ncbi:hypothetical protein [Bacillus hominis]|uniref:hypothetical protein n=1 Tax=Bacillus hominis TaxID=2817478 RepID=UPI001BB43B96|nr:hypothetical protein [Bacillus hominis]